MIAVGRVVYIASSLAIGVACGYFGEPWIAKNKEAISAILTIFSVLAGFLVAVIALLADDRHLTGATWRAKHYNVKTIRKRLIRHRMLFSLYLVVLILALSVTLSLPIPEVALARLNQWTLGTSVFALLLSFGLPHTLTAEYLKRLQDAVDEAKISGKP